MENNIRFLGQYYDSEPGLHYNYFRDYNPSLGRYMQSDPIGLRGGPNTYNYVFSNPLQFIDSLGLVTEVLVWTKAGGKDVGHTAIRLNNHVYGIYPTDSNGNFRFDFLELMNSQADLHIDTLAEFNLKYEGDLISVFTLNATPEEEKKLELLLNELNNSSSTYSLPGLQCTSSAINLLDQSGIIGFPDIMVNLPNSPNQLRSLLDQLYESGLRSNALQNRTIIDRKHKVAPFF